MQRQFHESEHNIKRISLAAYQLAYSKHESRSQVQCCSELSPDPFQHPKITIVNSKIPVQKSCGIHSCAKKADQPGPGQ